MSSPLKPTELILSTEMMKMPRKLPFTTKTNFQLSGTFQFCENCLPQDTPIRDDRFFMEHATTGARIETDGNGKRILDQLPASTEQLESSFDNDDYYLSPKLLHYYLLIFFKAGIIEPTVASAERVTHRNSAPIAGDADETPVSVVIVTFNGEKFISGNLDSLLANSCPAIEIIIVDNASSDGSIDRVEEKYSQYSQIKIIRNQKNHHYAKAVNIGVAAASAQLVIVLNQDILVDAHFIRNLLYRYQSEENKEDVAGVVPQMRFTQLPTFINGIGNFMTEKNWGSDNYFGVVDIGRFDTLKYVASACFGAIMVTKNAWAKTGGLDHGYKSFYEDSDWSMRVHLAGLNLLAAPEALVFHAFGGSYPSGLKLTFVAKNRMRFVFKHLTGKIRTLFFKKYLKQDIKNTLSFLRRGEYRNMFCYFNAYLKLFLELPNITAHRLRTKAHNQETLAAFFTKGAPYVAFSNSGSCPVINKHVIRSYYYFTELEDFQFPTEPITY